MRYIAIMRVEHDWHDDELAELEDDIDIDAETRNEAVEKALAAAYVDDDGLRWYPDWVFEKGGDGKDTASIPIGDYECLDGSFCGPYHWDEMQTFPQVKGSF